MSRSSGYYYDDGYPDYRAQSTSSYYPDYYGDYEYPRTDQGLDPYATDIYTYEPYPDVDRDRGRRSPQHRWAHNRSVHTHSNPRYETDRRIYDPFPRDSTWGYDQEDESPSRHWSSSPLPPLSSSPAYDTNSRRRSQSSTPPPPPSSPTPSYLAESLIPSSPILPPLSPRKLLILDLNGTLLLRSPHRSGKGRIAHPRPYMAAFREYIMHEETRQWLDVMVWSSAQPHSVADMVQRCFGEDKDKLVAIWARDSLGLSKEDYSRKAQTLKDLAKPWAQLPSPASDTQKYSPRTTLLLDDSPLKARLQPYNHVCIKEYAAETRARDLAIKSILDKRAVDEALEVEVAAEAETSINWDVKVSGDVGDHEVMVQEEGKKKRKRPKQKPHKRFDETLLAVVGVLDEIREQSNVAGWIRSGGLWITGRPPSTSGSSSASGIGVTAVQDRAQNSSDAAAEDKDGDGESPLKKHRRRRAETLEADSKPVNTDATPELASPTGNDAFTRSSPEPSSAPDLAGDTSPRGTTTQTASEAQTHLTSDSAAPVESERPPPTMMWFEDPTTFQQWSERGAAALEVLGIEVAHGIDR